MKLKRIFKQHIAIYRVIVAIGFVIAMALALAIPAQMSGASPWAYYYGVQNFSHGKLVIDNQLLSYQAREAMQKSGVLMQYVKIAHNKWALEKAPGYVFYLVPFELLGIPRWGNILLALGMVIVTFILLKRLRDEKTACIGSLLMLFTPLSLFFLNRSFMDSFASLSFVVMGGGLYIFYHLERDKLRPMAGRVLLFLAFLLTSWSVVTRYTNFPIAAILALHYAITRCISLRKGERTNLYLEVPPVVLGIGLPLAALLLYDYFVFGSPLKYGYHYTLFPIKFAYQYLGQVNKAGESIPLHIILENLKNAPRVLFLNFPLLLIGIPGFGAVLYHKFSSPLKRGNLPGRWSSLRTELSWDILLILIGWFISVFFLYMMYEFTAEFQSGWNPFYSFGRFYLPGLFPVAIICALIIARLPLKFYVPVLVIAVVAGSVLYAQYVQVPSYLP
jgi:hypothetical protein